MAPRLHHPQRFGAAGLQQALPGGVAGLGLLLGLAGVPVAQAQPGETPTGEGRRSAAAYPQTALLLGDSVRPLDGRFNSVPVLHSNQPEEVLGPGILIDTAPGGAWAAETGAWLENATYSFNGPFGLHLHHKYHSAQPWRGDGRRSGLVIAVVLTNPGARPVRIDLERGAVRNSFEAPYLGTHLMGVRPLGPRPWNTGPGAATAVQMLRGRLDPSLPESLTLPPGGRRILLSTDLPAKGIANALLAGRSDGPFHMAVVATRSPADEPAVFAVLDSRRLAAGRVYLSRLEAIRNRELFSRVGGVAIGDAFQASLSHDLDSAGSLHVPLTSTIRTHFGSGSVQVNPLVSRMVDSSLDNVGTYGVRFDLDLELRGSGSYELVISHPPAPGGTSFTAYRGAIRLSTPAGEQDLHVGLRSGQSLALSRLELQPGRPLPLRLSLVYPADATPGHLLSVVPLRQWPRWRPQPDSATIAARPAPAPVPVSPGVATRPAPPPPQGGSEAYKRLPPGAGWGTGADPAPLRGFQPLRPPRGLSSQGSPALVPPPHIRRATLPVPGQDQLAPSGGLVDRYRQAIEVQEREMRRWLTP